MTRAYLRLDPAYDEHKESYPDGPYAALISCFCQGELQPHRGRFRNERFLRALLGRRGRHIPYLIEHGDLVRLSDGRLYIDGWDEWQEGDWKVGERMARLRHRSNARRDGSNRNGSNGGSDGSPSDVGRKGAGGGAGGGADMSAGPSRPAGFKEKMAANGARVP